jgi:hypothetical protein
VTNAPLRSYAVSVVRAALRIFFCLAAWLMLSPLGMAAEPCAMPVEANYVAPCCEGDEPCGMPDMGDMAPCFKCPPVLPPAGLPAIAPDVAAPLLVAFERPILITIESAHGDEAFVVVPFHPPPPTLLALGTLLTC